jgi:hypothetical protein
MDQWLSMSPKAVKQHDCYRLTKSTLQGCQPTPWSLKHRLARGNVTDVSNWDTRRSHAQRRNCAPDVLKKDITTVNVK